MENSYHLPTSGRPLPVDADLSRRPGVPMLPPNPAPYPTVAGRALESQTGGGEVLMGVEARINVKSEVTPVYGTSVEPRGLSGMVRRASYKIPEHNASRWMLLMLGDRIDVLEGKITRHPVRTALIAFGLLYWWGHRRA